MDQQESPCDHNFLRVTPSYHSKVIHIYAMYAEKNTKVVLLNVITIAL